MAFKKENKIHDRSEQPGRKFFVAAVRARTGTVASHPPGRGRGCGKTGELVRNTVDGSANTPLR